MVKDSTSGLKELEKRIKALQALLSYLAKNQSTTYHMVLLAEHINAVLAYANITQYWPAADKARAKILLDEAIWQHSQWKEQLTKEHELLGQRVDRIAPRRIIKPTYKYGSESRMLNLQG